MTRRSLLAALTALLVLASFPGCIDDGDGPEDGGDDLPHEGTTEGFRLPDFGFTDQDGTAGTLRGMMGDYTMVHVVLPLDAPFNPQYAQIRAVRERFDNVTVAALTLSVDSRSTPSTMAELRAEHGADWTFAVSQGDLNATLSLLFFPTVFLLDAQGVVILRSDEPLGQGMMVEAVEGTWGIDPDPGVGPRIGERAPELVWRDIDGKMGSLSGLAGSVVLIDVWEFECPFCLLEFEELWHLNENYSARGLEIVSLDVITWETEDLVRTVAEDHSANWTFAVDGDNIQSRYNVWNLPLLVLIDRDGVVQGRWEGLVHASVVAQEVERLI